MLRAPKRLYNLINRDFKRSFLKQFVNRVEPRVSKAVEDKNSEGGDEWRRRRSNELRMFFQESLRGYHPDNDSDLDADKLSVLIDLGFLIADADDAYWNILTYVWNDIQESDLGLRKGEMYLKEVERKSQLQREIDKMKSGREPDFEDILTGMNQYDYDAGELKDDYE